MKTGPDVRARMLAHAQSIKPKGPAPRQRKPARCPRCGEAIGWTGSDWRCGVCGTDGTEGGV